MKTAFDYREVPWIGIASGTIRDRVEEVVRESTSRLLAAETRNGDTSLDGPAGVAILLEYMNRSFPNEGWIVAGRRSLIEAFNAASTKSPIELGLFTGMTGLAWTLMYLAEEDPYFQNIHASLSRKIEKRSQDVVFSRLETIDDVRPRDVDIVSGLAGISLYFACLLDDERTSQYMETVLEFLAKVSINELERQKNEITKGGVVSSNYPNGEESILDLGVAHGLAGILSALAVGILSGNKSVSLIEATSKTALWLCTHVKKDKYGIFWPQYEPDTWRFDRMAWCYGSPGVSRSLWLASLALDDEQIRDTALKGIHSVCDRIENTDHRHSSIFCHGNAGLLQIMLRFFYDTQCDLFAHTSLTLTERILSEFAPESSLGYLGEDELGNRLEIPGILSGTAGIVLPLLASMSNVPPEWDRVVALS